MIKCDVCGTKTAANYLYTQCGHLICLQCAAKLWDKKYSLRYNNQITFLELSTCQALLTIEEKNTQTVQEKENVFVPIVVQAAKKNICPFPQRTPNRSPQAKLRTSGHSSYQQSLEVQISKVRQNSSDKEFKEKTKQLDEMERLLKQAVERVKVSFQLRRQQLDREEQIALKEVYDKYLLVMNSRHPQSNYKETTPEAKYRESVPETNNRERGPSRLQATGCLSQSRPDKVLERLNYNEQKMKEKINKHYDLLK